MEGDPGYAGRDEVREGFEHFKRMKLAIDTRKVDPREKLYSHEQWDERLAALCEQYNAEPQQGKMTKGHCPNDALQLFRDQSDPPVRFDASCRYLLASHKRPIMVTANGITLRFGKQVYNYKSK